MTALASPTVASRLGDSHFYSSQGLSEDQTTTHFSIRNAYSDYEGEREELVLRRRKNQRATNKPKYRVLRRLRGFVSEINGPESKIVFVENESQIVYYLPTERLGKAGISRVDQPFEMDEFEWRPETGCFGTGYIFRPLANPRDTQREKLDFDPEVTEKLNALMSDIHAVD